MKKTLSIVLAVLTLLSVFGVTGFAVETPVVAEFVCDYDGIDISWETVKGAISYIIYRDGVHLDTVKDCSYTDKNVEIGVSYSYVIKAQDEDFNVIAECTAQEIAYITKPCKHKGAQVVVDYRATVYAPGKQHKHCNVCGADFETKEIKQLAPASTVLTKAANSSKGISLKWKVVDGADSYRIYRKEVNGEYSVIKIITNGASSYTDKTAKSGVKYKYVVRAVNEAGLSAYTSKSAKFVTRVATPVNLTAANKNTGIQFKWEAVEGAGSYRVYRKAAGDEAFTFLGTVKTTYYNDKKTEAGVDYIYTVKAVVNGTSGANLAGVSIKRLETPKLVGAKSDSEGIYIDFEQSKGATGYYVYRKVGNSSWKKIGTITSKRSHTYLDLSAQKGVTYTYTVKAFAKADVTSTSAYNKKGISCKDKY